MTAPQLAAFAFGEAGGADPAAYSRNSPSFYADPAGWLVTAAAADAFGRCPAEVLAAPDQVGVITLSRSCTEVTMRAIARTASRGMVSPLKFAGANPGVLAGLTCLTWKLRGPSLVLAMDPAAGLPVAEAVAAGWLRKGQAHAVLLAVHDGRPDWQVARCAVLRKAAPGERPADLSQLTAPGKEPAHP